MFPVFYYNYFHYYNEWQRFISDNKDLDIHIVHFEDFCKVIAAHCLTHVMSDMYDYNS